MYLLVYYFQISCPLLETLQLPVRIHHENEFDSSIITNFLRDKNILNLILCLRSQLVIRTWLTEISEIVGTLLKYIAHNPSPSVL